MKSKVCLFLVCIFVIVVVVVFTQLICMCFHILTRCKYNDTLIKHFMTAQNPCFLL